ncbi:hypothetical protein MN0502_35180 (plasmid) [Arthrobacter sp. MN05-02]|nr:hypothetical protein MN0502_35180 [Arthrobacter sp. MN05-02]
MSTFHSRKLAIDARALADELQDLVLDSGDIGELLTLLAERAAPNARHQELRCCVV